MLTGNDPGYLAVTFTPRTLAVLDLDQAAGPVGGPTEWHPATDGTTEVLTWGLKPAHVDPRDSAVTYKLVRGARCGNSVLEGADLHEIMAEHSPTGLSNALPPFGALTIRANSAVVATDVLGARQLYRASGPGWHASSTSVQALARLKETSLDLEALAVQGFVGWPLGLRTVYSGVQKIDGATALTLTSGVAAEVKYAPSYWGGEIEPGRAVKEAAAFLRQYMIDYLDQNPGATLQLTGGQDSRLILSAVPRARRKELTAMTLRVPGDGDVIVAADLAQRFGMKHEIISLDGLEQTTDEEAYERCMRAARDLAFSADPLEHAALLFAEAKMGQGPRLAGVGGEVARGYYYPGPAVPGPVLRPVSRGMAKWRMFSNLAVDRHALDGEFLGWAEEFALEDVYQRQVTTGLNWMSATDHFFLHQKMHRWAGITESAVCFDREVANPMLDRRWLDIACSLRPEHKRNGRFFNQVQIALDTELSRVPLEGRPAPFVYASASAAHSMTLAAMFGRRLTGKVRQRMAHETRPPFGGAILAEKVLAHWRAHPHLLEGVLSTGVIGHSWLEQVLAGETNPDTATIAFLVNVTSAQQELASPGRESAA